MTNKYQFYDVVIVNSNKLSLHEINHCEGVVLGMSQNEKSGYWGYAVSVYKDSGLVWDIMEEDLQPTGKKADLKEFLTGESIIVTVDPKTSEGHISDENKLLDNFKTRAVERSVVYCIILLITIGIFNTSSAVSSSLMQYPLTKRVLPKTMTMRPQNELETCLINARQDQGQSYRFYEVLLKSDIYFLPSGHQMPVSTQEGHVVASSSQEVSIIPIEISGKSYIPFFSSLERINAVVSDKRTYYKLASLDFFKMIKDLSIPLILNPGSNCGKVFTLFEINSLANGKNPIASDIEKVIVPRGDKLILRQPSNYPYELVKVLKDNFKKNETIEQAFLVQIFNPSTDIKPHTLIVIDTNDVGSIVNTIGGLINRIEIPDPPVDFTRFIIKPQNRISKYCLTIDPFYKK